MKKLPTILNVYKAKSLVKVLFEHEICLIEMDTTIQTYEKAPTNHDNPLYILIDFSRCMVTRILVDPDKLFIQHNKPNHYNLHIN